VSIFKMRPALLALTLAALVAGQPGSAASVWSQVPQTGNAPSSAFGVIAGTVIDVTSGQPIDGAVVHIALQAGTLLVPPLQMTDARGRFLFASLPAGSYTLRASKSGYSEGAYGRDAESGVTSRPIAIESRQRFVTATIAMAKPSTISGVVLDEAGEPMVNVFVRALRVVMMSGVQRVAAGRVTSTDDRGAFRLTGLSPGQYIVMLPSVSASVPASRTGELLAKTRESAARASLSVKLPKPDGALAGDNNYVLIAGAYPTPPGRQSRAYPPLFHPAGRTVADALPIVLGPGEQRTGVNFSWTPVGAASVSGRLVGPAAAIANMIVRLAPAGSESLPPGGEAATTVTTADGSFTFLRVPHGQYTLLASRAYASLSEADARVLPSPPAFREGSGGGANIPGSDVGYSYVNDQTVDTHTARQQISVGGESMTGLTVQLRPNVRLRGRVVIESGAFVLSGASGGTSRPPANGPVRAEPADGDLSLGLPGGMFDSAAGTFSVDALQPGEYVLQFMGLPTIKSITVGRGDFTTRPIDTSNPDGLEEIVVTVTDKVATLSGLVTSNAQGDGGQPRPSVVLYFPTDRAQWSRYGLRPTRIGSTSVSSSGSYKIDLPAGEYFVLAVPAAQNRLWQDPKRLAAASALATRVKLGWDEKRTETLTMKEVK
jgi:hypothetical protein